MNPTRPGAGWIEVIAGPMFSGKSEELIRLLKRAVIARQRVQVFKPKLDNRYSDGDVVSHSQMRVPCELVERADEIMPRLDPRTEVVGIDEAQFFDDALPACPSASDFTGSDNLISAQHNTSQITNPSPYGSVSQPCRF